jgi:hypothetical protein
MWIRQLGLNNDDDDDNNNNNNNSKKPTLLRGATPSCIVWLCVHMFDTIRACKTTTGKRFERVWGAQTPDSVPGFWLVDRPYRQNRVEEASNDFVCAVPFTALTCWEPCGLMLYY